MITLNNNKLCENCFSETTEEPCPHCGFEKKSYRQDPITLAMGSVLNQRYMIGGVIGKGGFGITYLAYDLKLDTRVAVKEYYPMGLAVRTPGKTTVTATNDETEESFKTGAEKFYSEAKMVAKFNGNPNIVSVHDFFYENDTVYFTMGYLQGETLKSYLKNKTITEGQAVSILNAVSNALMASHGMNILHRDISPDNIMLCDDQSIRLLDFGAARQVMAEQSQSLSVILKQGYAPLEQYQKKGKQGPWTDIYALGATVYSALTGDMLSDPMTRLEDDSEFLNNKHGISENLWNIIKKCTELKIQDRYQDVASLKADLKNVGIEPEPFTDIKEEITDILRHRFSKPTGGITGTDNPMPNYAPAADPNATMMLGPDGSGINTASLDKKSETVTMSPEEAKAYTAGLKQDAPEASPTDDKAPASSSPLKNKSTVILIAVIAALLIIGILVTVFIVKNLNETSEDTPTIGVDPTEDSTEDGTEESSGDDSSDDRDSMLKDLGYKKTRTYSDETYLYSICYPNSYTAMEADPNTVEIADKDGSIHMAVRYMDRYLDGTILYDATDLANMINVRPDNLLPVEGTGSTPEIDNWTKEDVAGLEDISHVEYHYEDNDNKTWNGDVYLFDSEGQYGCFVFYALVDSDAEDSDRLKETAAACVDSFMIDDAYDPPEVSIYSFDDYGIKFSVTDGIEAYMDDGDSIDGTARVRYKTQDGENKIAFIIPADSFGTEYTEMITAATTCLSNTTINPMSDMIPVNLGEYQGYWIKAAFVDPDGSSEDGRIYALSTNLGSDAKYQSYVIMGSEADTDRLEELVGGFRFEGATTFDNLSVDEDATIPINQGSSGGDDIDEFLDDYSSQINRSQYIFEGSDNRELTDADVEAFLKGYLESNNARGKSDSEKRALCARALCYARNEIYARHGYIFNSGELRDLFSNMSWYTPTIPSDRFNSNVFNAAEKHNIEFLKSKMEDYGGYQPAK